MRSINFKCFLRKLSSTLSSNNVKSLEPKTLHNVLFNFIQKYFLKFFWSLSINFIFEIHLIFMIDKK